MSAQTFATGTFSGPQCQMTGTSNNKSESLKFITSASTATSHFSGVPTAGMCKWTSNLETVFDIYSKPDYSTANILVSLPMMARWHSSAKFDAERILRQSGEFDYSEPQFFHWPRGYSILRCAPCGALV